MSPPSPENFASEILSALCTLIVTSTDKNSCTRALWVISKQSFPSGVVAKKVSPHRLFTYREMYFSPWFTSSPDAVTPTDAVCTDAVSVGNPQVDPLLDTLERVMSRQDIQSVVMEHEALNVVIR